MKARFPLSAVLPVLLALALLPCGAAASLEAVEEELDAAAGVAAEPLFEDVSAEEEDGDADIDPFGAVVKLEVVSRESDFVNPWLSSTSGADGSGVVVAPGRILTCAHCVADATHIRVRKNNEDSLYQGALEFVDNDCDLALVRVEDPAFMHGVVPMSIGETPALQDMVVAVGYPLGGDGISFTRGIVSRIEDIRYSQSLSRLLGIQVDSAINPGNSGGPVIDAATLEIVGIAFQGRDDGESLGYIIPPEIIRHFFTDIEDGRVDGFPQSPFACGGLECAASRRYLGMAPDQSGLLVENVAIALGTNSVRTGDVLLEIDGRSVANNGNIRIDGNERRSYAYPIYLRQIGESVPAKVLRGGQVLDVSFPAIRKSLRVRPFMHGKKPDYYVLGGFVFSTLSLDFLRLDVSFHDDILAERTAPDDEAVVITDVLADSATEGYLGVGGSLVRTVNGVKVRNLRHLVEIVESCHDEFLRIMLDCDDEYDTPVYLDLNLLREATPRILERYDIPSDRSKDLR